MPITTSDDVEGALVPRPLEAVVAADGACFWSHQGCHLPQRRRLLYSSHHKRHDGGLGGRLRGEIPRQGCGSQRLHQRPRVPDGVPRRNAGPLPGCLHDREDSCFHPCTNVDSRVDMKKDRVDKAQRNAALAVLFSQGIFSTFGRHSGDGFVYPLLVYPRMNVRPRWISVLRACTGFVGRQESSDQLLSFYVPFGPKLASSYPLPANQKFIRNTTTGHERPRNECWCYPSWCYSLWLCSEAADRRQGSTEPSLSNNVGTKRACYFSFILFYSARILVLKAT